MGGPSEADMDGVGPTGSQERGWGEGPWALRALGVRLRCLSSCPAVWSPRAASVAGRWGWHARLLTEAPPLAVILSGPLGLPLPSPILGHSSEPHPLWRTGREPGPFCLEVGSRNVGSRSERVGRAVTPTPPVQAPSSELLWNTCARTLCCLLRVLCHQDPPGPTHRWAGRGLWARRYTW